MSSSRRIIFILPGYPFVPVGGYKLVFQYANEIALRVDEYQVEIWFSLAFYSSETSSRSRTSLLKDRVLHQAALVRRGKRFRQTPAVPWFKLNDRIVIRSSSCLPRGSIRASDIVVATSCETAPWVSNLCEQNGARGVYFIQGVEDWGARAEYIEETWRLPLKRIVISPWLQGLLNGRRLDSTLVMNGLDTEEFPAGPPLASRPKQVLAMASVNPSKRLDLIECVYKTFSVTHPNWKLVAFGVGHRPAGFPSNVEFVENPPREHISALYRESRVFMVTSDHEGWGLPAAEALASGTALVSTDIEGVRAFAEGAASFVPTNDCSALVDAVEASMELPNGILEQTRVGQASVRARPISKAAREFVDAATS